MLQLRGFNLLVAVSRNGHWPKTLMNSVLTKVTQWLINITWYKTSASIIFKIYLYMQKLHYFEMCTVSTFFLKCLEIFSNYFDLMSQKFDPIETDDHHAHAFFWNKKETHYIYSSSVSSVSLAVDAVGAVCGSGNKQVITTHKEMLATAHENRTPHPALTHRPAYAWAKTTHAWPTVPHPRLISYSWQGLHQNKRVSRSLSKW